MWYLHNKNLAKLHRRRGMAMVYIILIMTVLIGFCSLAVDLGRVVVAKTQLRFVADAAARAAVAALPQGNSSAKAAAVAMAANNKVDGTTVSLNSSTDVSIGIWNSVSRTFSTSGTANNTTTYVAVQVTARRTSATNNPIQMTFASILGFKTFSVTATSVAALVTVQDPVTQWISATGDPWLSGEPAGTLASVPDPGYSSKTHPWEYDIAGTSSSSDSQTTPTDPNKVESSDYSANEQYDSPSLYTLAVTPGSVIQLSVPLNSSNQAVNQGYLDGSSSPNTYANGDSGGSYSSYANDAAAYYGAGTNPNGYTPPSGYTINPIDVGAGNANSATDAQGEEHGMSNINTPINSLVGVFQNGSPNDTYNATTGTYVNKSTVPPGLDFSTQSERDYTNLEPELFQTFYAGSGQTSTGVQQTIVVPQGATQLYFGTMDGHEWSNNLGGFNVTVTQFQIAIVQ